MAGGSPFCIGAACLPFGLWLRAGLPETMHLTRDRDGHGKGAQPTRLGAIRANARVIVLGLLILASGTIITYVTQYMTTYAENTLHVATELAFATSVVSNGASASSARCTAAGWPTAPDDGRSWSGRSLPRCC